MTRPWWVVLHVLLILLVAYGSSYASLSRKRWKECQEYKLPGFFYVSPERLSNDPDGSWGKKQLMLAMFYAPANKIDRAIFRGPTALPCVLIIGGKKPPSSNPREY